MIVRHAVKSCCGSKAFIFETETAVNKNHLEKFKSLGYIAAEQYTKAGMFCVTFQGLVATASFGATRINIRCSSANCENLLNSFENTLDELTRKKS